MLKQEITTNLGKKIDITPSGKHRILEPGAENPGRFGEPNSSVDIYNRKGELSTRRWYDKNGRVYRDVDMTNHGNPKNHPEYPHEHLWKFDDDGNFISR